MRQVLTAFILATALALSGASARAAPDIPIMAGGDPNSPPCADNGEVVGLDPRGDGFFSIQSGPGGKPYFEKDRVFNGQKVAICERRGRWLGIVYDAGGSDCGLGTPRDVRQAYTGPCRSGWAYAGYVRELGSTATSGAGVSCPDLWRARNQIFKNAGYCFKTSDAIEAFGNAGCRFDNVDDVPLSPSQREAVASIRSQERNFGCPQ